MEALVDTAGQFIPHLLGDAKSSLFKITVDNRYSLLKTREGKLWDGGGDGVGVFLVVVAVVLTVVAGVVVTVHRSKPATYIPCTSPPPC